VEEELIRLLAQRGGGKARINQVEEMLLTELAEVKERATELHGLLELCTELKKDDAENGE
jgi:hypothetical protein